MTKPRRKLLSAGQSRCADAAPASSNTNASSGTPSSAGKGRIELPAGCLRTSPGRLPSRHAVRAATAALALIVTERDTQEAIDVAWTASIADSARLTSAPTFTSGGMQIGRIWAPSHPAAGAPALAARPWTPAPAPVRPPTSRFTFSHVAPRSGADRKRREPLRVGGGRRQTCGTSRHVWPSTQIVSTVGAQGFGHPTQRTSDIGAGLLVTRPRCAARRARSLPA